MLWKPSKALGLIVGVILLLTLLGSATFLLESLRRQPLGLGAFLTGLLLLCSLPLLAILLYGLYGLITLRYELDRNALVISSGLRREVIPLPAVQRVLHGSEIKVVQGFRGLGWPGYLVGRVRMEGDQVLLVHGTEPLARQVVIVTEARCYGISPRAPEAFIQELQARQALGPVREVAQRSEHVAWLAWPVWRDRWFLGLVVLSLLASAALFGLVLGRYGSLPERLPLRFFRGEVERVAAKSGLLLLPSIGGLTWVVNTLLGWWLHQKERLGAYLLVTTALLIHLLLWPSVLAILGR